MFIFAAILAYTTIIVYSSIITTLDNNQSHYKRTNCSIPHEFSIVKQSFLWNLHDKC